MKSVRVVKGVDRFVVEDIDRPALPEGAVRVRITAAFLPSFFRGLTSGEWRTPPMPFTPGLCAIGTVLENADPVSPLRPGLNVYCDMYIEGWGSEPDQGFIGCFGITEASSRHLAKWPNGTFAEEFVGPPHCFTPIPSWIDVSSDILCRLGWFATALEGFNRGGFKPGQVVAINGAAGLLGSSAALVALAIGASEVRLVGRRRDVLEEIASLDKRLTIEDAIDPTPLDFVLDCAGGDSGAATVALGRRLKRFGALVFIGALSKPTEFDTSVLMRNSNSLIGSFWFPHRKVAEVLALIGSGAINVSRLRAESFSIDDIEAAMRFSTEQSGGMVHVVVKP